MTILTFYVWALFVVIIVIMISKITTFVVIAEGCRW